MNAHTQTVLDNGPVHNMITSCYTECSCKSSTFVHISKVSNFERHQMLLLVKLYFLCDQNILDQSIQSMYCSFSSPRNLYYKSTQITLKDILLLRQRLINWGGRIFSFVFLSFNNCAPFFSYSRLHRDAVWSCLRGCIHHGFQLSHVRSTGIRHSAQQFWQ